MKGLLDDDKTLQIEALEGLIEASKKLGLDATRYQNALRQLKPPEKKRSPIAKPTKKKRTAATSSSTQSKSKTSIQKKPKTRKPTTLLCVKKMAVESGLLEVAFDAPASKEMVHHFTLKKKDRILYIFDVRPAKLREGLKRLQTDGVREIRIAQNDRQKVRIVIETSRAYRPTFRVEGKWLRITLPGYRASGKKAKSGSKKPDIAKKKSSASGKKEKGTAKKRNEARTKSSNTSLSPLALRRYTVVIDPGHGGKDAGAVGYRKRKEKDAVLALAKELKKILKKRGFKVYLTREKDRFIPLKKRTRFANRKQADVFISIHANAVPKKSGWKRNRGIETYFLSRARTNRAKRVAAIENSAEIKNIDRYTKEAYLSVLNREKIIESNKLAIDLQRHTLLSLRKHYKDVVDNGVREGPFWVLVGAQMPAVLIEVGYITNPTESQRLFNARYRKLMAEGIANGIESYIYHNK
jgi:N-acetylmuramoyl-L-alanine amidase